MEEGERYYIYTLSGSEDKIVGYVGWTVNAKRRLYAHIASPLAYAGNCQH